MKIFYVNKPLQSKIKVRKFHSTAANGLATEAFQKYNWGQIDPMVDRGLKYLGKKKCVLFRMKTEMLKK